MQNCHTLCGKISAKSSVHTASAMPTSGGEQQLKHNLLHWQVFQLQDTVLVFFIFQFMQIVHVLSSKTSNSILLLGLCKVSFNWN